MAYRLAIIPRVAERFVFHIQRHVIRFFAHFARRGAIFCLIAGLLVLMSALQKQNLSIPVDAVSGGISTMGGKVVDPAPLAGASLTLGGLGGQVVLGIERPSYLESLLIAMNSAGKWLCVALAGFAAAPLVGALANGEPFDEKNPRRLLWISFAIFAAGHLLPLLTPLAAWAALHRLGGLRELAPHWPLPLNPSILIVLLLLLLAGALRSGRSLQEDVEGLV